MDEDQWSAKYFEIARKKRQASTSKAGALKLFNAGNTSSGSHELINCGFMELIVYIDLYGMLKALESSSFFGSFSP